MKDTWSTKLFGVKSEKKINTEKSDDVVDIPLRLIDRSPYQPRENINVEKVNELAQSIKTYGLLQPIVVRKVNDRYEIVAGERRYLALKRLNRETIKAIIKDYTDSQMAALAMIENLQRENLNIIEEAMGYKKLIDEFNLTQEALAQRLGKSQSTIANKVRLIRLPENVKKALGKDMITERHARCLLKLEDQEKQNLILDEILREGLNVKQTEEKVDMMMNFQCDNIFETEINTENKKSNQIRQGIVKDYRIFVNTINRAVSAIKNAGVYPEVKEENYDDRVEIRITLQKHVNLQ